MSQNANFETRDDGKSRVVISGDKSVTTDWHEDPKDALAEARSAAQNLGLNEAAEQVEALAIHT